MRNPIESRFARVKPVHPLHWLWETVEQDATFVLRSMFGAKAVYLDGKIVLCFCASDDPWRGVLICTDPSRHAALRNDFPELVVHPVLSKWLYLPESAETFERAAPRLVTLVRRRDPRIGVTPKPKKKRTRRQ
jgi:hypothetical protein